jgi:hypothetical protein
MPPTVSRFAVLALLTLALSATFSAQNVTSDLTVHEWGTFTSIAGRDGQAVKWSPLNGSTDLPGFVQHFHSGDFKVGYGAQSAWRRLSSTSTPRTKLRYP